MLDREQARRDTRRFQSRLARRQPAPRPTPAWRTWTTARRAASTVRCSRASPAPTGSTEHRSVLITGPCGVGKSWLACALGQTPAATAAPSSITGVPRLFADLELARGDGRFARLFRTLAKRRSADPRRLGPRAPHRQPASRPDGDRRGPLRPPAPPSSPASSRSTPGTRSSASRPSPTPSSTALVHNAYRIALDGPSMRKSGAENGRDTRAEAAK